MTEVSKAPDPKASASDAAFWGSRKATTSLYTAGASTIGPVLALPDGSPWQAYLWMSLILTVAGLVTILCQHRHDMRKLELLHGAPAQEEVASAQPAEDAGEPEAAQEESPPRK